MCLYVCMLLFSISCDFIYVFAFLDTWLLIIVTYMCTPTCVYMYMYIYIYNYIYMYILHTHAIQSHIMFYYHHFHGTWESECRCFSDLAHPHNQRPMTHIWIRVSQRTNSWDSIPLSDVFFLFKESFSNIIWIDMDYVYLCLSSLIPIIQLQHVIVLLEPLAQVEIDTDGILRVPWEPTVWSKSLRCVLENTCQTQGF